MTKSQPAHLVNSGNNEGFDRDNINGRNLHTKTYTTAIRPNNNSNNKPLDSVNIMERIQSKIEEKMTRADTSTGLATDPHVLRNIRNVEVNKKSSTSIGGKRRCPNLQKLIEKKKLEDDTLSEFKASEMQLNTFQKGASILQTMEEGRSEAQIRARTGDIFSKQSMHEDMKKSKAKSLYPWEQRLLSE